MGAQLGSSGTISEINMTPLIDIVLVVLIIMMVNMPIEIETLGVKLPDPNAPKPTEPKDPVEQLVIMLYEDGRVALNRQLVDENQLSFEITRRLKASEKKIVFIDAYPAIEFGSIVDMIDLARENGAVKVAFARLKDTGPLDPTSVMPNAMQRGVYQGTPSVVGAITEKQADTQFKPLMAPIRGCYDAALAAKPTLTGRMVLRLDVWPEGEIIGQEIVVTNMDDEGLASCILEAAPSLRFEPLGEGNTASVQIPLLFSPG